MFLMDFRFTTKMKNKLKVALVATQDEEPSLMFGYLVSWYRKYSRFARNVSFSVIEVSRVYNRPIESAESVCRRLSHFDVVGFSTISQDFGMVTKMCRILRKTNPSVRIILGGYHISGLPCSMPRDADIAVLGEGEATFQELLDHLVKAPWTHQVLSRIRGIAFFRDGDLVVNRKREIIRDLDSIPPPARDIFRRSYWWPVVSDKFQVRARVFTARGCPYSCVFCNVASFWGSYVRFFSAQYVADEIEDVFKKYGCTHIIIADDLFTINKARLQDILALLKEKRLLGKLNFTVQARANLFDHDIVRILKSMNVVEIGFGIESGSDRVLRYLKGPTVTVKQNYAAIKLALANGFTVWPQLVVGCPKETVDDIKKTLEFTRIPGINNFQIGLLTPLPGTPLWDYALGEGLVSSDMDWSRLNIDIKENELGKKVFLCENLTIIQVWDLIKKDFYRDSVTKFSAISAFSPRRLGIFFKYFFSNPKKYFLLSCLVLSNKIKRLFV
jgi:radical SAM superfamily enzyme YgiQ (UPF0313 family)